MTLHPPPVAKPPPVSVRHMLPSVARNSPEQRAIDAGEIDAVIDYAGRNVILLPSLRRGAGSDASLNAPTTNRILAALPRKDYLSLLDSLEPAALSYGSVLCEPGEAIQHVYFPLDCLVSVLATVESGESLEVGLIGAEGMVGVPFVLGMPLSPVRVQVRKGGAALRMRARPFRKAFLASSALQRELCRYAVEKLALARQSAACSRFHTIEARVARLLLMTADRVRCEEFFLTQAFLGEVLGERRVAVNEAAGVLQRRKLIGFVRGKIRILDRSGLEAASCRCYVQLPHGAGAESTVSHAVTA